MLYQSCAAMRTDPLVIQAAQRAWPDARLLIASDNMDCWERNWSCLPLFHGVLCSASLGVCKAEDPEGFFAPVLGELGLSPGDAAD